jgi:predicted kinase
MIRPMPVVTIPDPSLVVLIGPAGAGKSSLAARLFSPDEILSSDAFRAAIAGDAADQRATRPAFAALHRALARRLAAGRLTVVDATNVERHARLALVRRARAAGIPAVALVLDLPAELVLARNAGREGRVVDPAVVRQHLAALRDVLDRDLLLVEGWTTVIVLADALGSDGLSIARAPRSAAPA